MAAGRARQLVTGDCSCSTPRCGCVVVDTSLGFVLLSLIGPLLLVALAVFWLAGGAPWWVWPVLLFAVAIFGVVLFDMPVSSAFAADGVTRRTPLRDHVLSWDQIDSLGVTRNGRKPGLVAQVGRRKYLLAERAALTARELELLSGMRPE